jgi:hypothetical protein
MDKYDKIKKTKIIKPVHETKRHKKHISHIQPFNLLYLIRQILIWTKVPSIQLLKNVTGYGVDYFVQFLYGVIYVVDTGHYLFTDIIEKCGIFVLEQV